MIDNPTGRQNEGHAADAGPHAPESGHRSDHLVAEVIRRQRLHVIDPELKAEEDQADQRERDHRVGRTRGQYARRHQKRGESYRRLSRTIYAPAALDQKSGSEAAEQAAGVSRDERNPGEQCDLLQIEAMSLVQEQRQPRYEQPPDRIDQQTRENDGPDLPVPHQIAPFWGMGNGEWGMGNGIHFSTPDSCSPTPHSPLPTPSLFDQAALLVSAPTMAIGRLITEQPERQPQEAQRAGNDERRLPSVAQLQPADYRRSHYRADGRAAVEDGHCEGALAHGKPFGDDLCRARPVPSLTQSEQETKHT